MEKEREWNERSLATFTPCRLDNGWLTARETSPLADVISPSPTDTSERPYPGQRIRRCGERWWGCQWCRPSSRQRTRTAADDRWPLPRTSSLRGSTIADTKKKKKRSLRDENRKRGNVRRTCVYSSSFLRCSAMNSTASVALYASGVRSNVSGWSMSRDRSLMLRSSLDEEAWSRSQQCGSWCSLSRSRCSLFCRLIRQSGWCRSASSITSILPTPPEVAE